jgi:Fe-S cluster biogenesis protein NfuA
MTEDLNAATPSTPPQAASSALYKRVDEVLDRIRPYVQSDGGHVELVNVDEAEGTAFIRFQGACSGCPSSAITLQMGVENEIRTSVPEIKQVVAVS